MINLPKTKFLIHMLVSTPTNINKLQIKEDLGRCVQLHGGEMACQVKFDSFRRKNTGKI